MEPSGAELWAQRRGHSAGPVRGERRAPSNQRREQQKNGQPAATFANVFMAGAYYSSAMNTAGGPQAIGTVFWQHHNEDSGVIYRSPAMEPVAIQQAWPFPPWRLMRQRLPGSAGQAAVMCADEDPRRHDPNNEAAGYGQHNAPPVDPHHQQHNWGREDNPYEDDAPGNNGQGDGDAPTFYGEAGEGGLSENIDVLLEEQEKIVAMLAEIDERHEKQLAFERMLQEQEAPSCLRRGSRQQHRTRTVSHSESLDVFVKASPGPPVSHKSIHDSMRQERWYSPAALRTRSSSLLASAADDNESGEDVSGPPSPTITMSQHAVAGTSPSHSGAQLVVVPVEADAVHGAVRPKGAAGAVRSNEKIRRLKTSSQVQPEERLWPQPAQDQPPPPQKQDVPLAAPRHQQGRRAERKRSSHTPREHHSTRK